MAHPVWLCTVPDRAQGAGWSQHADDLRSAIRPYVSMNHACALFGPVARLGEQLNFDWAEHIGGMIIALMLITAKYTYDPVRPLSAGERAQRNFSKTISADADGMMYFFQVVNILPLDVPMELAHIRHQSLFSDLDVATYAAARHSLEQTLAANDRT